LIVGDQASVTGAFFLSNGSLSVIGSELVGHFGAGMFDHREEATTSGRRHFPAS